MKTKEMQIKEQFGTNTCKKSCGCGGTCKSCSCNPTKQPPLLPNNGGHKPASYTAKIVDKSTKESLPGAHVVNTRTKEGVITDDDGVFNITNTDVNDLVKISFVGFKEITLPATSLTGVIELQEDNNILDEIVITAKKSKKSGLLVAAGLTALYAYSKTRTP